MPKYRTTEPVVFVRDGRATSVKADRVIELEEHEARELAGKVLLVENKLPTMFPNGSPIIEPHIVRPRSAQRVAGVPVQPLPKPAKSGSRTQPKTESK